MLQRLSIFVRFSLMAVVRCHDGDGDEDGVVLWRYRWEASEC